MESLNITEWKLLELQITHKLGTPYAFRMEKYISLTSLKNEKKIMKCA